MRRPQGLELVANASRLVGGRCLSNQPLPQREPTSNVPLGLSPVEPAGGALVELPQLRQQIVGVGDLLRGRRFDENLWQMEVSMTPQGVLREAIPQGYGADATDADFAVYAKLKIGSALTGLTFAVDVNGAGGAQTMRLLIASTTAVDVRAIRKIINF